MKTILIPTDFSGFSFTQVERLLLHNNNDKVRLVFFHAFEMPNSEQDMFGPLSKPHLSVLNETFRKNCCKLKDNYPALTEVCFRHFYGSSRKLLTQFLEHNKIDALFIPQEMVYMSVHKQSLDISTLLLSSGLPVVEVKVEQFRLRIANSGNLVNAPLESFIS